MKNKYDYVIVGAGLYGAVFAQEAKKHNKTCLVIEKRNHIGGNIYTEAVEGIQVHKYGAHIFHTSNEKVWNYVNQFVTFNNFINAPIAIFKDEVYNLPFNMNTFYTMWGVRTPVEAREKIQVQIQHLNIKEPKNLEEQALSLVGTDVYEKLIKGYTKKQWGRDCTKLPAFIIKRLPLRFTYNNNYFNDRYQGIPKGGYTLVIERMLADTPVLLNTDYKEFIKEHPDIANKTIYTGMIDEFYDYQLGVLEYRSLEFQQEVLEMEDYQGNAVVNYTEEKVPYTRIIEHKHFDPLSRENQKHMQPEKTVITREYPKEWEKGDEPYYPVNNKRNQELYQAYKEYAKKDEDIVFGGRLGAYQYYDMDKVIEAALRMTELEFV